MPSSPVGSYAYDYSEIPAAGVAPPAVRRGEVSAPDSEPIARTAPGPRWSHSDGGGSSGKMAPVCAQTAQFRDAR